MFVVSLSFFALGGVLLGPSHPRNVEVRATSSASIHVKWEEPAQPNGVIGDYIISFGTSKDYQPNERTVKGNTMERILDGLNKFTTYFIKVRGKTSKMGNASKILNATTYEDSEYRLVRYMPYSDSELPQNPSLQVTKIKLILWQSAVPCLGSCDLVFIHD